MTAPRDTGSEPRTEAGRRLLTNLDLRGTEGVRVGRMILAIEAEAARTADDRLARVVEALRDVARSVHGHVEQRAKGDRRLYVVHLHETLVARIDAALAIPVPDRPAAPVGTAGIRKLAESASIGIHNRDHGSEPWFWACPVDYCVGAARVLAAEASE